MSELYVCKEYETPYEEGYRVVRTIEEHNKIIYNQALEDFITEIERQTTFYCGKDSHLREILEQLKR